MKYIELKTILFGLCFPILLIWAGISQANTIKIKFAYIGSTNDSAYIGISQGLTEANLQGQFLGQAYSLDTIESNQLNGTDFSKYIAILAATDADMILTLAELIPDYPIFNLAATDDSLRETCLANVLHITPSERMRKDAIAQWHIKQPDADVEAKAWHPDFVKFAARDLNKRFRKASNIGMDDLAWAGWAAVKMTSDTVAREDITTPIKMLNYLKTSLSFDGQKGMAMNFRETGQLRQLLLVVENDNIVGEAPVRGVVKTTNVDSLGITNCPK